MLLLADIGNSEIVLGLRDPDGEITVRWRVRSADARRTADEFGVLLRELLAARPPAETLQGCCISSVVPSLTGVLAEGVRAYLGVETREFRFAPALGIRLDVDEPAQVGADRVANTLAAHLGYPGPAIVVDLGTATKFDVVGADGTFLGGIIAPGIESGVTGLSTRTALLPRIAPGFPDSFIGKTTVANMQIGVYQGAVVLIDGLVRRIRAEWESDARVIATGGLAGLVSPHAMTIDVVDPDLTLKGIGWGHDRLWSRTV
ncbi:MAG: type III pantothenate kinase [Gemmatimonadota bacterium]